MRRPDRGALTLAAGLLAGTAGAAEVDRSTLLSREEAHAWRAIGRVNVAGPRARSQCTGTLIAPDLVLTAAHCLVHPATGQPWPAGNVHFVAGWYGGDMTGHARAAALVIPPDYHAGAIGSDIALIRLREPLGEEAGPPFALAAPSDPGSAVTLISYRRDRAHAPTLQDDCRYEALEGPLMLLRCPVTYGASGSPVLAMLDDGWSVVGVLSAMGPAGRAIAVRADIRTGKLLERLDKGGE